jgi:hypothetical protein
VNTATRRVPAVLVATIALLAGCDAYTATPDDGASGTVTPELTPGPSGFAEVIPSSPCGAVGDAGPAATIETLKRVDRSCVEPDEAMIVRCDPALDPIAILDAGTDDERLFVGGAYAVPVDELPGRTSAIGFGTTGRYYRSSEDARLLFAQSGAEIERWLALPRQRLVAEPPTALLVGDSILDGSSTQLTDALSGWSLTIDAAVGRSSSGGISVVEGALTTPDVAVLELGTNDHDAAIFRANADRILAAPAVAEADLIVWLTARNPNEATPAVNDEILSAMSLLPNGTVADWDRAVPADALNGDGVHLAAGNEAVFSDFLAPVLEAWRDAVHHRGPAACVQAAVDALS